jgi:hypothetical protein
MSFFKTGGRRTARAIDPQSVCRCETHRALTFGCHSPPLNALCSYLIPPVT